MKKAASILAIALMGMGMVSCENDNAMEETQALYETLNEDASDSNSTKSDPRD
ncbi:hypothetical protein [Ulvibacterium sp.]|uniref:hypothetical protein n=1 Tax=Ulvibacterium sp. TaxID=2665914 RepID=UPI00262C500A|nr:hypothetical protein [Ulvibacterium sp.]